MAIAVQLQTGQQLQARVPRGFELCLGLSLTMRRCAALLCHAAAAACAAASSPPRGDVAAAEAEVRRAAAALHEAQLSLAALREAAAAARPGQQRYAAEHEAALREAAGAQPLWWAGSDPLPSGNYTKACTKCGRMGTALWCTCGSSGQQSALSLEACIGGPNATVSEVGGFLTCPWKRSPPPRTGNVTTSDQPTAEMCRVLPSTTFLAPQFKQPSDPISSSVLVKDPGTAIVTGTWTGLDSDGSTLNDLYLIEVKANVATFLCVDSGPMASARYCDDKRVEPASHPDGNGGVSELWHAATATVSTTSLSAKFDSGTQGTGTVSLSAAGGTMIKWDDGTTWIRCHFHSLFCSLSPLFLLQSAHFLLGFPVHFGLISVAHKCLYSDQAGAGRGCAVLRALSQRNEMQGLDCDDRRRRAALPAGVIHDQLLPFAHVLLWVPSPRGRGFVVRARGRQQQQRCDDGPTRPTNHRLRTHGGEAAPRG